MAHTTMADDLLRGGGPYYVLPHADGGDRYEVVGSGDMTSVLEHAPMTLDAADYLAAHINHAFRQGCVAGSVDRARQIRTALGVRD
jgi:hypothetical protein